eukprot:465408-Karenia_brevis.AAC.1
MGVWLALLMLPGLHPFLPIMKVPWYLPSSKSYGDTIETSEVPEPFSRFLVTPCHAIPSSIMNGKVS